MARITVTPCFNPSPVTVTVMRPVAPLRARTIDEREPVEGLAFVRLERHEAGRIAVVGGDDLAGAVDREANPVAGARRQHSVSVDDAHGDERQIGAVG